MPKLILIILLVIISTTSFAQKNDKYGEVGLSYYSNSNYFGYHFGTGETINKNQYGMAAEFIPQNNLIIVPYYFDCKINLNNKSSNTSSTYFLFQPGYAFSSGQNIVDFNRTGGIYFSTGLGFKNKPYKNEKHGISFQLKYNIISYKLAYAGQSKVYYPGSFGVGAFLTY